ncbi:MAG: hypothetical protein SD837_15715 [Candidatus Electrothrix scaldis]|nr:MAG: hypothetical protein SD837_15715 [Candidatus Electrothrix sp. GW3-3]
MTDALNKVIPVDFASENIVAYAVSNVQDFLITQRSIIVNMGLEPLFFNEQPQRGLAPRKSTIIQNRSIVSASLIMVIEVKSRINLGNVILSEEWASAEKLFGAALHGVPLWKSPQVKIGELTFNPFAALGQNGQDQQKAQNTGRHGTKVTYQIKVNIWFATECANCVIHNQHNFIEFHTQITGTGRMQKFADETIETLYEDVILGEGQTHEIFCNALEDGRKFEYPWHQYYSDTDCIWMATELHPVP